MRHWNCSSSVEHSCASNGSFGSWPPVKSRHFQEPMNKHREAVAAFQQGNLQDELQLFDRLLQAEDACSELWNAWATVQAACGELRKAEAGFLRALGLDPANHQAKSNL